MSCLITCCSGACLKSVRGFVTTINGNGNGNCFFQRENEFYRRFPLGYQAPAEAAGHVQPEEEEDEEEEDEEEEDEEEEDEEEEDEEEEDEEEDDFAGLDYEFFG